MKNQNFGIEIEMTGITRQQAANAIAAHFGTTAEYTGTYYGTYMAKDAEGKSWNLMSDASIKAERKKSTGKGYTSTDDINYSVELVSPILQYNEIEKLQMVVRVLRKTGAKVNASCGIHVHVGAEYHTAKTLRNALGIMYTKEDLLFKALQVRDSRVYYCQKTRRGVLEKARAQKNNLTMEKLERIWYGDGYDYEHRFNHYNNSRYHALNLHATFTKKQ